MKRALCFLALAAILFLTFSISRPLEDDESLYLLTGQSILDGSLHPFRLEQEHSTHNPFMYIMGSPLAPTLHALAYLPFGLLGTRALTSIFVLSAILLIWHSRYRTQPHYILLLGALPGAILIASNAYLDALALLFLTLSLHQYYTGRLLTSGILASLAMTSKYILIIPFVLFVVYLLYTRQASRWILGASPPLLLYALLMHELIPSIIRFVLANKASLPALRALPFFIGQTILALPILSTISFTRAKQRTETLLISAGVLAYHFLTLDYVALIRHAPYAEFAAAFTTLTLRPLIIIGIIIAGPVLAYDTLDRHPDLTSSSTALGALNGTILTRYPYQHALITNHTFASSTLTGLSGFDYDLDGHSTLTDYENALTDEYFDYAITSTETRADLYEYTLITALIEHTYCVHRTTDTLTIYAPCKTLNSSPT